MKILIAQINSIIGDINGNQAKILFAIEEGKKQGAEFIITPELALVGYPPEDFLLLSPFIQKAEEALQEIILATKDVALIVGTIRRNETQGGKPLFNSAAICLDGKLLGFQDKTLLPTYDVFDERRYFEPAKACKPWHIGKYHVGVTICEDMWQHSDAVPLTNYLKDPIDELAQNRLDLCLNLSSSPFDSGKLTSRIFVAENVAKSLNCPFVVCNQVGGNDSLIFDGHSLTINSKGQLIFLAKGYCEDYPLVDTTIATPHGFQQNSYYELHQALILGVKDYFEKQGFKKACIGISGGIDSALVACLAVEALGKENVLGVAMPSRYSSKESLTDAKELTDRLGISLSVIPIEDPFESFLNLLKPHFEGKEPNTTEENLQARIRGIILMALSNKHGYIVLSTGNKSELALGYSTLYGDMCGGLAVISDLTKEQVYALSSYINSEHNWIPESIMTKAPSAELRPNQKDSDSLPEYPLIDTVLKAYIEFGKSPEEIIQSTNIDPVIAHDLIRRVHANEYKRRQSPPGLKVTEKAFSIGRKFPIVQKWV